MINLSHFNRKFTGVVHVGAHDLQELEYYKSLSIEKRYWIDGARFHGNHEEHYFCGMVGDGEEINTIYHASNNGESTSILKPKLHLEKYPEIKFREERVDEEITALKLDWFNFENFDLLVLDIQGMEYRTLNAMQEYATHFDAIVTEAYLEELYEGCGYLHEIDALLEGRGYERIAFEEEQGKGWGNAYYQKK